MSIKSRPRNPVTRQLLRWAIGLSIAVSALAGRWTPGLAAETPPRAALEGLSAALQPPPPPASGLPGQEQNPWLSIFPELAQAPAPAWVREGVRITYRLESATIAQDPDQKSSAAAGYLQYDIVAIDGSAVVSSVKMYLDTDSGAVQPSIVMAARGRPGIGDYWLNPGVLAKAGQVASDELKVISGPATIGTKSYQVVRFEYHPKEQAAEYIWMVDPKTGLLLYYRYAIGAEDAASRQTGIMTFVQQRQLPVPWQAAAAPDWLTPDGYLAYEGEYAVEIPGSPATSLPYTVVARVTQTSERWTDFQLTDSLSGSTNSSVERVTGVAQLTDGLWLPPEAIASLQDGQVLDQDPVTGDQLTASVNPDHTVTLTEAGAGYQSALTYSAHDGKLVGFESQSIVGIATIRITMQLSDWQ